jgi:hypothetical protein
MWIIRGLLAEDAAAGDQWIKAVMRRGDLVKNIYRLAGILRAEGNIRGFPS